MYSFRNCTETISNAQNIADTVSMWSIENRMQLNPDKCKELRTSFNAEPRFFDISY